MVLSRSVSLVVVMAALVALPALAADKKKPKADADVDAFFDPPKDSKKATSLDDLNKASSGMGTKEKKDGMAPKGGVVDDEAPVNLHAVFAAQKIVMDKKLGCQPAGRDKKKLTFFTFDELPQAGVPFDVCVTVSSKVGREMSMSVAVIDARNARVVKAEDVIDFRGRAGRMDHVLEFPAPMFKMAGPYQYLIELDGKEVGRLPLFEVKVNPEDGTPQPMTDAPTPALPIP
ncbi:MAG: hypothetical protein Q8O67_00120 [Deltaproteobacteria bacterium]|nr:hypothetical protein [Deltaproteobacteria bacterium]